MNSRVLDITNDSSEKTSGGSNASNTEKASGDSINTTDSKFIEKQKQKHFDRQELLNDSKSSLSLVNPLHKAYTVCIYVFIYL